ncbi:MAG: WecB/TagA/CpsF family glycosyltransferase [Rhodoferax sp.]|nr:WecB/TagA/CpsF family glycosyltransferase [Rhodoferax sp.]
MLTGNREPRDTIEVLGVDVTVGDLQQALDRVEQWAADSRGRSVCFSNVHSLVTASGDPTFRSALQCADMVLPDGAPVAWMMRRYGQRAQRRVCGPDFMAAYMGRAAARQEGVFLLGSTTETLQQLEQVLTARFPGLRIVGSVSPPFRELSDAEDQALIDELNRSGAATVWVSLGCPKQERWMAAHKDRVGATLFGVGAAFDFHAATVQRAPAWMQRTGLEWAFRLFQEPRRLAARYLTTNTRFAYLVVRAALGRP